MDVLSQRKVCFYKATVNIPGPDAGMLKPGSLSGAYRLIRLFKLSSFIHNFCTNIMDIITPCETVLTDIA